MKIPRVMILSLISLSGLVFTGCMGMQWEREKMVYAARINELESQNKEYRATYYDLIEQQKEQQEKTRQQITSLEQELAALKQSSQEREQELTNKNEELEFALQQKTKEMELKDEKYKVSIDALNAQLQKASVDIEAALRDKQQAQTDLAHETTNLQQAQQRLDEFQKRAAALDTENANLKQQLDDKSDEVAGLRDAIIGLESKIETLQKERTMLLSQIDTLKKENASAVARAQQDSSAQGIVSSSVKNAEQQIKIALSGYSSSGTVSVSMQKKGLVISIQSDYLFDPGTIILNADGKALLQDVVEEINKVNAEEIIVEGHTDNQPLVNLPFYDNWALGSARSSSVVRFLIEEGVEARLVRALSASMYQPLTSNDTPEGRQKNRRVDIVLR